MYVPSLWYYEHLTFLEEHFVPRKSKSSPIGNTSNISTQQNIQFNSQVLYYIEMFTNIKYTLKNIDKKRITKIVSF